MNKYLENRLTIYNIKGGVGKTRIALNLAMTMGWGIVTNEQYSVIEEVLPKSKYIILEKTMDNLEYPPHIPLIFDLGGKEDQRAIQAMEQSKHVIVPVLPERGDLQISLNFIQELKEINNNIIIVVNQTKPGDFQKVSRVIQMIYPELAIFELKASTAMSRIVTEKKPITEIITENKLFKYHYKGIANQFEKIINHIQK